MTFAKSLGGFDSRSVHREVAMSDETVMYVLGVLSGIAASALFAVIARCLVC